MLVSSVKENFFVDTFEGTGAYLPELCLHRMAKVTFLRLPP